MLSSGSQRVKAMADDHPVLNRFQQRMDQFDAVSFTQKVQVAFLATVQGITVGTQKIFVGVRRLVA